MENKDLYRNKAGRDEEELLQQLASGNEQSFNSIYKRYAQRMLFFAMRYITEDDAKDAVAEAFIALWERRTDFSNIRALQHFLFVTVRNRCINIAKREEVRMHNQSQLSYQLGNVGETELEIERLSGELVRYVYREIEKLPPRQREIFLLSFRDGLKPGQIAEKLNINVQTVSNQKLTIIRLLRHALGPHARLLGLVLFLMFGHER